LKAAETRPYGRGTARNVDGCTVRRFPFEKRRTVRPTAFRGRTVPVSQRTVPFRAPKQSGGGGAFPAT
jgi:hypothetical protein